MCFFLTTLQFLIFSLAMRVLSPVDKVPCLGFNLHYCYFMLIYRHMSFTVVAHGLASSLYLRRVPILPLSLLTTVSVYGPYHHHHHHHHHFTLAHDTSHLHCLRTALPSSVSAVYDLVPVVKAFVVLINVVYVW